MEPYIPQSGQPIKASWARDLILWIKHEIKPRGDGKTTIVKDNVISALVPAASGGGEVGVLTSGPSGGYGAAVWQPVEDDLTPTGATVPVIVLPLK